MGGKNTTISTTEQRLTGVALQSSAYGIPIPLVYGTQRVTGNLIWFGDFVATPHTTSSKSGGKGGSSTTQTSTTYTYSATAIIGLCEGPVNNVSYCWADKDLHDEAWVDANFYASIGSNESPLWGYMTTNHPTEDIPYSLTAYVGGIAINLPNAQMPNHSFEVLVGMASQYDPASKDWLFGDVVMDFLQSPYHGAGFVISDGFGGSTAIPIDTTDANLFWIASGMFVSPIFTEQQPARQHLEDVFRGLNAAPVWSDETLKIICFCDVDVTGNGVTYTAPTTPEYNLTVTDFLTPSGNIDPDGNVTPEDPILMTRKAPADMYNHVQVEYLDRASDYNISIMDAKDQSSIENIGERTMDPIKCHYITTSTVARLAAQYILQRQLYIINTYEFYLGLSFCLLEPGDLVTITDANMGLSACPVRIIDIEESADGILKIIAEDWTGLAGSAETFTPPATGGGYTPNTAVDPGDANAPVIFEPPTMASGGVRQLWMATSGGVNWGSANVWVSTDGTAYQMIGQAYPGNHGALTDILPTSATHEDDANTLSIDTLVSLGYVLEATEADKDNLVSLCYVDGEMLSYWHSALTGSHAYDITYMLRGAYGTTIGAHASASDFVKIDGGTFKFSIPGNIYGETIYIKLQSVNVSGNSAQDLSGLTAYPFAIAAGSGGVVPPAADGVTLVVSDVKPVDALSLRYVEDDGAFGLNDGGAGGTLQALAQKWLTITWSLTPAPGVTVAGYEIIVFTGTDPTDVNKYVIRPILVDGGCAGVIVATRIATDIATAQAAVRVIYE
jgi:hypothetical protein